MDRAGNTLFIMSEDRKVGTYTLSRGKSPFRPDEGVPPPPGPLAMLFCSLQNKEAVTQEKIPSAIEFNFDAKSVRVKLNLTGMIGCHFEEIQKLRF